MQDWLLVETLGEQPVVVAHGRQIKNFVPIAVFLRRNPNLAAIQTKKRRLIAATHTAMAETLRKAGIRHLTGNLTAVSPGAAQVMMTSV